MAVYTQVPAETLAAFLGRYDVGTLVSAKGIAEGVENSNYLVETDRARFILTLYEKRVEEADLPYFLGLTEHLAGKGLPVPAPVADSSGNALQDLCGRKACLIEFLKGVSAGQPSAVQASAAGRALARLHLGAADYPVRRRNALSVGGWQQLSAELLPQIGEIDESLPALVAEEMSGLSEEWPADLPSGTIHADMFPDNVLFTGERISGIIDFYFACTDLLAYDLAVTHAAWAFDDDGHPRPAVGDALLAGYEEVRPLERLERQSLNTLCRGASIRFLLTRAYDWFHTAGGALVNRKDPMAFARRLMHYRSR